MQAEAEGLVARMGWHLPKAPSGKHFRVISQKERDAIHQRPALLILPLIGLVLYDNALQDRVRWMKVAGEKHQTAFSN